MSLTRRRFLGSVTTLAAATATAAVLDPAAAGAATLGTTIPLHRSTFARVAGKTMTASSAHVQARIRLTRIRDILGAPAGSQTSFLLQFTSAAHLPDGVYTVRHPSFGHRRLFLSGVNARSARRYEAVVNQQPMPTRKVPLGL